MEQIINGRLIGDDYRLELYTEGSVSGENEVALSIVLEGVKENDMQLMFEYPAMLNRRNVYYSEFMRLNEVAPNGVVRYEIPRSLLCCAGKVYVQAVLGVTGSLKWSAMGEDASFVTRVGSNDGTPESGMLMSIRSAYERTNAALEELEHKTAEDFGGVSNKGGAIEGNLDVSGTLRVNGERTATERELAALRTELGRESLDIDPHVESTAGSVVTVEDTPTGKYLESDDYKVTLPLRQYVSPNLLSAQPIINNQVMTLADFGRDVTMSAIIGFKVENFSIASAAGAVIDFQKADGTHQYRTGGAFGWKVGETYTGVYTNKAENLTFRYVMFYGYNDGYAIMSGTIKNGMMNSGSAILPYEPYTGNPSPSNPIPVESPSAVTVRSESRNLLPYVDNVNISQSRLSIQSAGDGMYQMTVVDGNSGKLVTVPIPPRMIRKGTYYMHLRNDSANSLYSFTIGGIDSPALSPVNRVFTVKVVADTVIRDIRFYCAAAATAGVVTLRPSLERIGDVTDYVPHETETATIAPRDVNGNAVALSGGVAGAENTIEYKDGKPYYVARTTAAVIDGGKIAKGADVSNGKGHRYVSYGQFFPGINNASHAVTAHILCNGYPVKTAQQTYDGEEGISQNGTDILMYDIAYSEKDITEYRAYLNAHPITVYYELATPVQTELDPASLPILQTYSPETTFYISSDVEGLNASIDLTGLSAQNATFAKGMLKLNNGEVLTPLTTADMVLTADGRALDTVIESDCAKKTELAAKLNIADAAANYLKKSDAAASYLQKTDANAVYATKSEVAVKLDVAEAVSSYLKKTDAAALYATKEQVGAAEGTKVTVGGAVQSTWNADTKLDANATAVRATADANGNAIATTYATKSEVGSAEGTKVTVGGAIQSTWDADTKLNVDGTAVRAVGDASGNTITTTYAKKTEVGTNVTVGGAFRSTWNADTKLNVDGTAVRAVGDASGNTITETYATKEEVGTKVTVGGALRSTWNADTKLDVDGTAIRAKGDASGNTITETYATKTEMELYWEKIYPVGAIYITTVNTSPATLLGGTWERIQDRFLLAAGSSYAAGGIGGESAVALSKEQMPSHNHDGQTGMLYGYLNGGSPLSQKVYSPTSSIGNTTNYTGSGMAKNIPEKVYSNTGLNVGNSSPHNNMPPYLTVYMWKRTA